MQSSEACEKEMLLNVEGRSQGNGSRLMNGAALFASTIAGDLQAGDFDK